MIPSPAQGIERKLFADTLVQAVEAVVCTFGIVWGFAVTGKPGAIWALVSAVIVLRPGFEDSLRASEVRIAANMVGALVGVAVGMTMGLGAAQIALALAAVIVICHWRPLEKGVRSACAGVVIVMMHEGSVEHMGLERLAAVLVGCLAALVVGYVGDKLGRNFLPRVWRQRAG